MLSFWISRIQWCQFSSVQFNVVQGLLCALCLGSVSGRPGLALIGEQVVKENFLGRSSNTRIPALAQASERKLCHCIAYFFRCKAQGLNVIYRVPSVLRFLSSLLYNFVYSFNNSFSLLITIPISFTQNHLWNIHVPLSSLSPNIWNIK